MNKLFLLSSILITNLYSSNTKNKDLILELETNTTYKKETLTSKIESLTHAIKPKQEIKKQSDLNFTFDADINKEEKTIDAAKMSISTKF